MTRKRMARDPYGAEIWFLFGTGAEIETFLRRKHGGRDHIQPDDAAKFITFTPDSGYAVSYIALVRDRAKGRVSQVSYIAHECVHAVFEVFHARGITCDSDHDEPFAYYHEWLFRQCLRAVW